MIHRGANVLEKTYLDLDFTTGGYLYNEVHDDVISTSKNYWMGEHARKGQIIDRSSSRQHPSPNWESPQGYEQFGCKV